MKARVMETHPSNPSLKAFLSVVHWVQIFWITVYGKYRRKARLEQATCMLGTTFSSNWLQVSLGAPKMTVFWCWAPKTSQEGMQSADPGQGCNMAKLCSHHEPKRSKRQQGPLNLSSWDSVDNKGIQRWGRRYPRAQPTPKLTQQSPSRASTRPASILV